LHLAAHYEDWSFRLSDEALGCRADNRIESARFRRGHYDEVRIPFTR
jgi:hypothetical protein